MKPIIIVLATIILTFGSIGMSTAKLVDFSEDVVRDDRGTNDPNDDQFWVRDLNYFVGRTYEDQIGDINWINNWSYSPYKSGPWTEWRMAGHTEMQALWSYPYSDIESFFPSTQSGKYGAHYHLGRYEGLVVENGVVLPGNHYIMGAGVGNEEAMWDSFSLQLGTTFISDDYWDSYTWPDYKGGDNIGAWVVSTIPLPPNANFTVDIASGVAPHAVNFNDTSSGDIIEWKWDFGDGNTSIEQNPKHTYTIAGVYNVSLTVSGHNESDSEVKTNYISIISIDSDNDGVPDHNDGCPNDANKIWPGTCGCGLPDIDTDNDTIMDCADMDDDNDGVSDEEDIFPLDDSETLDSDEDGTGDNADMDDDNDGIIDVTEAAGPNSGDANNDGTLDSLQNNVASVKEYNAEGYVVLETPTGTELSSCQAADNPSPGDAPSDVNFDYGFFGFTISGIAVGGSTTLTMTLPNGITVDTYYRYGKTPDNQVNHWYEFLYDGETGAEINNNVITFHFVDASRGDDILMQDSMVIDLGGPGFTDTIAGEGGGGSGGCFILTTTR